MIYHRAIANAGFISVLLLSIVSVSFADIEAVRPNLRGTKEGTPSGPAVSVKRGPEGPVIIHPGRKLDTNREIKRGLEKPVSIHAGRTLETNKVVKRSPEEPIIIHTGRKLAFKRRNGTPRTHRNRRSGTTRARRGWKSAKPPTHGNRRSGNKRPGSSERWFGFGDDDDDDDDDGYGGLGDFFGGYFPFDVGDMLEFGSNACVWINDEELGWVCELVEDVGDTIEDEFGNRRSGTTRGRKGWH